MNIRASALVNSIIRAAYSGKLSHQSTCSGKLSHQSTCSGKLNHYSTCSNKLNHQSTCSGKLSHQNTRSGKLSHQSTCSGKLSHQRHYSGKPLKKLLLQKLTANNALVKPPKLWLLTWSSLSVLVYFFPNATLVHHVTICALLDLAQ